MSKLQTLRTLEEKLMLSALFTADQNKNPSRRIEIREQEKTVQQIPLGIMRSPRDLQRAHQTSINQIRFKILKSWPETLELFCIAQFLLVHTYQ